MSYTPIGWQTGDTITAEKLNKMDPGWGASSTQLFSETVTIVSGEYGNEGSLTYTEQVSYSTITVVFNNTAYTCNRVLVDGNNYGYGGVDGEWSYDFSVYPFALVFSKADGNIIATETTGTHTVSVSASSVETSQNFAAAVGKVTPNPLFHVIPGETTWQVVYNAVSAGKLAYVSDTGSYPLVMEFVSWIGEDAHGDFVVATIYYNGSAVAASRFYGGTANGALVRG